MGLPALFCLAMLGAPPQESAAAYPPQERVPVNGQVVDVSAAGTYVDLGRDRGVRPHDEGLWSRDGQELGRVRVVVATATSCLVEILDRAARQRPRIGDKVVLQVLPPPEPTEEETDPAEDEEFVPLLARKPVTTPGTLWNGFLRASYSSTTEDEYDSKWTSERLSTAGAGERLGGGPWSMTWSADLHRFDGSGYSGDRDDGDIKMAVDELTLQRHFADGSSLQMGRVNPLALSGLGRVDGVLGEVLVDEGFRVGALTGLRPDPDDLGMAQDDVVLGGYASWMNGADDDLRFWTTAGVLATFHEGESDQQALLVDSRMVLHGRHSLWFSGQADWYTGSEDTRDGIGLTRAGFSGTTALNDTWYLLGSVHHYELPDTLAWRELVPEDGRYGRGHRRVAVGLREVVSSWVFEEEVASVSGEGMDSDFQYTLRVQKNRLPGNGFVDVSVYNLVGMDTDGVGGAVTYGFYSSAKLSLLATWQTTRTDLDMGGSEDVDNSTASLSADWRVSDTWWLSARAYQSMGDYTDATGFQMSVTWRF